MHDIRFIRENPDAFDRGLARRGLAGRSAAADRARREAARENPRARNRAGAPQRSVQRNRRSQKEQGRRKGQGACWPKSRRSRNPSRRWRRTRKRRAKNSTRRSQKFPIYRSTTCLTARTQTTTSSVIILGRSATMRSRQNSISISAKRSARWISRPRRNSPARALSFLKKGLARLERALGQFMLDVHTSEPHNYTEIAPPLLVRDEVMFGTAQLPKFAEDQFRCDASKLRRRRQRSRLNVCVKRLRIWSERTSLRFFKEIELSAGS